MASGVKFCRLLLRCADERLPVICFVSSGGMQTKEGAGSLFSMAIVNDRITRFVRENELPVLVFGFGDCTGGAQASLVTHPLVETFYFSGTSMPFAGQIGRTVPFAHNVDAIQLLVRGARRDDGPRPASVRERSRRPPAGD